MTFDAEIHFEPVATLEVDPAPDDGRFYIHVNEVWTSSKWAPARTSYMVLVAAMGEDGDPSWVRMVSGDMNSKDQQLLIHFEELSEADQDFARERLEGRSFVPSKLPASLAD
jgi:hypothetical protein